ncbi:HicB family protein [Helicobacter sp. MIT 00-7814]|uniref:type II toxin-antitoxin system HicB family antitoxin n=1 Tax=unclassified Helicobacter TaxID=2593540 RepID=UPI000E1E4C4F|nr:MULTISPECIES: type II toxin-antitoxin system HicB family antitoxin [unclassified Helicobacter]RDU51877.1 HicB family protein [Helicobacter sp. MIT 99-10781]RDU52556.1 HicB family protein [Helicobacter sp. MIT 00-7814]
MKDKNYYLSLPYEIIVRPLSKSEGGGYLAKYKDFPYILGDGESEKEAIDDVKSAFEQALCVMLKKGDYIKEPDSSEAKVRINITLPKSLLEKIDKVAHNRSKFLSDCAAQFL